MTSPKRLTESVSVSPFVPPEQLAQLAPEFRTIINNRPDGEEPGQASSAAIEAEAGRLGLDYLHIPVVPGQISDVQVQAFAEALANAQAPVLAFCRTGTRSATLWALSQAGKRSADEIVDRARAAGCDLSALAPRLEEQAGA